MNSTEKWWNLVSSDCNIVSNLKEVSIIREQDDILRHRIVSEFVDGMLLGTFRYNSVHYQYSAPPPPPTEIKKQLEALAYTLLLQLINNNPELVKDILADTFFLDIKRKVYAAEMESAISDKKIVQGKPPKNRDYDYWWDFSKSHDSIVVQTNCPHADNETLIEFEFEFDDEDEKNSAIELAEKFIKDLIMEETQLRDYLNVTFISDPVSTKYTYTDYLNTDYLNVTSSTTNNRYYVLPNV